MEQFSISYLPEHFTWTSDEWSVTEGPHFETSGTQSLNVEAFDGQLTDSSHIIPVPLLVTHDDVNSTKLRMDNIHKC